MKIYSEGARVLSENSIKTIPIRNFAAGISCCYSVGLHLVRGTADNACPGTAVNELFNELRRLSHDSEVESGKLLRAGSVNISLGLTSQRSGVVPKEMELLPNQDGFGKCSRFASTYDFR